MGETDSSDKTNRTTQSTERPELRTIGVLSPVAGPIRDSRPMPLRVESKSLVIGRDPDADNCCVAVITDDSVSPEHACVVRKGDDFVLENLDRRDGTYVDGVPIVSCVLRDGDMVQIGRNLFCFIRQCELTNRE